LSFEATPFCFIPGFWRFRGSQLVHSPEYYDVWAVQMPFHWKEVVAAELNAMQGALQLYSANKWS
jgi:hypothetical protein